MGGIVSTFQSKIRMRRSLKQREQWYGYMQTHLNEQKEQEESERKRMKAHSLHLKKLHGKN
jgi:hypothetical protein|tara:strand:- start:472 stop:654 length:183 start_codon:yes stop_codon:yes gene_type:complete